LHPMGFLWSKNNATLTETGCKDCGCKFKHYPPEDHMHSPGLMRVWSNVHVIIYDCPYIPNVPKHFAVEIKGSPSKLFLTCGGNLGGLMDDAEIKRILEWANCEPEE